MTEMESPVGCPYCRHERATRVKFTPWGGVVGPMVFSLVQCAGCAKHYNGRSGRKVEKGIRVYTWMTMVVLAFVAAWAIYAYAGTRTGADKGTRGTVSSGQAVRVLVG